MYAQAGNEAFITKLSARKPIICWHNQITHKVCDYTYNGHTDALARAQSNDKSDAVRRCIIHNHAPNLV